MSRIDGGLRQIFRDHLPAFMWTSIETGGTGQGIPDLEYCSPAGISGWIECKKSGAWAVDLEPEQIAWLSRRARYKGRCWVAVRRKNHGGPRLGLPVDQLWLVPGAHATELKARGLGEWAFPWVHPGRGPARWSWDAIARLLTI